jgi:hypothetical protein
MAAIVNEMILNLKDYAFLDIKKLTRIDQHGCMVNTVMWVRLFCLIRMRSSLMSLVAWLLIHLVVLARMVIN